MSPKHSPRVVYGLAILAPILAVYLRNLSTPLLGDSAPFAFVFITTALIATYGGLGPGLVATFWGAFLTAYQILVPGNLLTLPDNEHFPSFLFFLFLGSFISYLCGSLATSRRNEEALRLTFQQTLLGIGDAIISTDSDRRIRIMNRAAEQLTGWSREAAGHHSIYEVFRLVRTGADTPASNPVEQVLATNRPVSLCSDADLIALDGRRIPIDHSAAPIRNPSGRTIGTVLVFRDVTERRRSELALAAAEKRARTVLESISECFYLLDRNWRFKQMNPMAAAYFDIDLETTIGASIWDRFPQLIGTELEVAYRRAMDGSQPERFDFKSATSHRWASVSAYPSEEGLAVYFRDIARQKQEEAELRRLNEDLKQFTYAASHDLREPLRMITVYSELLSNTLGPQLEGHPAMFLSNMVAGAQRICRLIDGLLKFTQIGALTPVKPQPVDAVAALEEALELLQLPLEESEAHITYSEMPAVLTEPSHLTQVFQNLIANALKYTPEDMRPQIGITTQQDDKYCKFCVTDNGIGIEQQFQAQIFQPFKRLHGPEVPGAGIGLATCKRIVEHYGGRIWVESEGAGKGSTFCFSLPLAAQHQTVAHV